MNALGPLLMLEAFAEHVTASRRKTVIMVSSRMGIHRQRPGGRGRFCLSLFKSRAEHGDGQCRVGPGSQRELSSRRSIQAG